MTSKLLMTRAEVEAECTISKTTIYRMMRAGAFPCPVKIGERAVRWRTAAIQKWLDSRPEATGRAA